MDGVGTGHLLEGSEECKEWMDYEYVGKAKERPILLLSLSDERESRCIWVKLGLGSRGLCSRSGKTAKGDWEAAYMIFS